MKSLTLLLTLLWSFTCLAGGDDDDYSVSKISPILIKDVNVVVRREDQRFEMKSLDKAVEYYRVVYTIMNENADKYSSITVPYDRFTQIDYINGNLYDANGKKIRSLKKGDIADKSGTTELADDNRYKECSFYYKVYPYTVEFEYSLIRKETMFFPEWYGLGILDCAVEQSNFSVIVPNDYKLRYKMFNYAGEPVKQQNGDKTSYTWVAKNLPAIKRKFGFPGWRYLVPFVLTGPSDFQIDDYKGSMTTWEEMGKFALALKEGRDQLPDDVKAKVHELIKDKTTLPEKVDALYQYMQKNTRYVSIQLGIGGWRPFEASYVAQKGYGDCKALSNYMYSLLKEAGIKSYYTLITAGDRDDGDAEDIVTDFPSSQFNHVILCVPNQKDTIWLECTSQDAIPGFMGSFTGNRHALLITEDGGKLVPTVQYNANDNLELQKINAKLNTDGSVNFQSNTDYLGMQQEVYHDVINTLLSKEKVNEFLQRKIDLATFDVLKYEYKEDRSRTPKVNEKLDIAVNNYAQVSGKRIFLNPNFINRATMKLPAEERTYPIWLSYAYIDKDTVTVEIPEGYKPESIPSKIELKSVFGSYEADYRVEGNHVYYVRRMERHEGMFPKESYADLVKFCDQIYKADRGKVVLVKNE